MNTPPKLLHVFRPGRHVAMSGDAIDFSETDLQATAAAYDPAKHEAPLVVGHPKADAPAYGWVAKVAFGEAGLEVEPSQVNPDFAELVKAGSFKKISASFYSPTAPNNPVPGVYYLRHVGFLGAQPPAVKGLRSPEFADSEEGIIEFGDYDDRTNASLWRALREWVLGNFGVEEADRAVPGWDVSSLERSAAQPEPEDATPQPFFSETPTQETQVTPEQKAALEAENAQLKQQLAAAKAASAHAANKEFAEGLIKDGKLLPVHKDFIVSFMDHVAGDGVIEFGEGDAKQSKPVIQGFKDYLAAQPRVVDFSEHAGASVPVVDMNDATAIHAKAVEFQEAEAKAGRVVDIAVAVAHVTAGA